MVRLSEVEGENDKLARDNDMLSTYIDNLWVYALVLTDV